jgi:ATP-binding cassette subfamily F protein 3
MIHNNVRVWYYSQDFAALDPNVVVRDALLDSAVWYIDQDVYRVASQLLLTWNLLKKTIWSLSEGQKWLLCYAQFILNKPHLLILDEPTNHINFRHLPIIAKALNAYEWAMIIVSHDVWFIDQLEKLDTLDLWHFIK